MEWLYTIALFLHITSAMLMVAGLIGREVNRRQARHSGDIATFVALMKAGGRFESLLVIPGSMGVLIFGIIVSLLGGWPLFGFLQGSPSNWLLVSVVLTLATIPLIVFVFVPRGRIYEKALEAAVAQGQVTGELTAVMDDNAVRIGHIVEAVLTGVVLFLMVAKPF